MLEQLVTDEGFSKYLKDVMKNLYGAISDTGSTPVISTRNKKERCYGMKAHIKSNSNSAAINTAWNSGATAIATNSIKIDETLKPTHQHCAMEMSEDDYGWKPIPAKEIIASAYLSNGMYITIGKNLKAADIYKDDTLTELVTMEHGFVMCGYDSSVDSAIKTIIALVESYLYEFE